MKIIKNSILPPNGYLAITIGPYILTKYPEKITDIVVNHENIHYEQEKELGFIPFYLLYGLDYIIKLLVYRNHNKAYRGISFEREAYSNETDLNYIKNRDHYSWIKRILK